MIFRSSTLENVRDLNLLDGNKPHFEGWHSKNNSSHCTKKTRTSTLFLTCVLLTEGLLHCEPIASYALIAINFMFFISDVTLEFKPVASCILIPLQYD